MVPFKLLKRLSDNLIIQSMAIAKDKTNPYRYGVLIANHVEDRIGQDLVR
jgi:hypothetical protein